ncbi:MAG: DNA polymerase III subunit alpha, partial [Bacteroidetes bacterium]
RNGYDARPRHSFCGIITDVQQRTTKNGKPIVFAQFEDFTGQAELLCFASQFDRLRPYLQVDEVVLVRGSVETRGGSVKIILDDVMPMWKVREQLVKAIVLRLDLDQTPPETLDRLHTLCEEYRGGSCKLYFEVTADDLPTPQRLRSRKYVLDPAQELFQGLHRLFGRDGLVLEGEA